MRELDMGDAIKVWAVATLALAVVIWGLKGFALLGGVVWLLSSMVSALLVGWLEEDRFLVAMMVVSTTLIFLSANLDPPSAKKLTVREPVHGEACAEDRFGQEHCISSDD